MVRALTNRICTSPVVSCAGHRSTLNTLGQQRMGFDIAGPIRILAFDRIVTAIEHDRIDRGLVGRSVLDDPSDQAHQIALANRL
jgi:hypothetical protein